MPYTNYGAFGYNTRTVAKTNVPKSFNDLLRPEWKGQIAMEGRAYEWFGTTLKAMGEEKGMAYMREQKIGADKKAPRPKRP